ncbi:MAG: 3-phosphoshikimate 1-carboxyvinyltransferase [Candidatus Sumerlaeota bacterium]|nr:3-phosphoshikimate 1-carboxyvinyltransferase [Candidatus Sumerlaeota bacterium]
MLARIHPALKGLRGVVEAPSSKNYTTRYILAACLADGRKVCSRRPVVIERPAVQEDSVALVRCCRQFGARITAFAGKQEVEFSLENAAAIDRVEVVGFGNRPKTPSEPVDPANAGTVLRLLLGVGALCDGPVTFVTEEYEYSLGRRPNRDLLEALRHMGVEVEARGAEGMLPITLTGGRERIKRALARQRLSLGIAPDAPVPIPVSGEVSSQFVSSLLFMAPLLGEAIRIDVRDDLKSRPLIATTLQVLARFQVEGIAATNLDRPPALPSITLPAGLRYLGGLEHVGIGGVFRVNGDWPGSAAILAAAAAVPGSDIAVKGLFLDEDGDEQGEKLCQVYYGALGCKTGPHPSLDEGRSRNGRVIQLVSPERLLARNPEGSKVEGMRINGDMCTDAVLAMMGAAALVDGRSIFTGVRNLQFKECDRIREPIEELRRIAGTDAIATWEPDDEPDTITVDGCPGGFDGGITVDGRGDHRVIMMLSIVGLRCRKGLSIAGAEHVAKSFPAWFDTLRALGAQIDLV